MRRSKGCPVRDWWLIFQRVICLSAVDLSFDDPHRFRNFVIVIGASVWLFVKFVKKTEEEVFTFPFHFLNLFWKSETKFPILMKFLREAHLFSIYQQQVDLKYHLVSR